MARILVFIFCFFLYQKVNAQLVDMLGNLSIQNSIQRQSVQSVGHGLSSLHHVQILQEIQQIATEIQTTYFGNYYSISKNSLSRNYLTQLNWNLGTKNSGFYIQLKQINQNLCQYLIQNQIMNCSIQINENTDKSCHSVNTITYYFD